MEPGNSEDFPRIMLIALFALLIYIPYEDY